MVSGDTDDGKTTIPQRKNTFITCFRPYSTMKTSYDTNTGEWKSFFQDAFCASDTAKHVRQPITYSIPSTIILSHQFCLPNKRKQVHISAKHVYDTT